ncbi:MAG: class B sortase [Lachnospiraceae bacterium]|nr:class B sortase [Lachnospiraceae bacterium]
MAPKVYIVEGRQFRTPADAKLAETDKKAIDLLREKVKSMNLQQLTALRNDIANKKIKFHTILGDDFLEELDELIRKEKRDPNAAGRKGVAGKTAGKNDKDESAAKKPVSAEVEAGARAILQKQEKRRRLIVALSAVVAVICIGYIGFYYWLDYRNSQTFSVLSTLKENADAELSGKPAKPDKTQEEQTATFTLDEVDTALPEVLPEFEDLLKKNRNLIGWIKIADILSDEGLPVMQLSADNPNADSWYLNHSFDGKDNRNGTLFIDSGCDVAKPSTNLIIYGHHMKSGAMFGKLDKYEKESFWENHKTISFDSIYEHGTYDVMYVFRTHLDTEDSIAFKYYQFYEAYSAVEFDSYMDEMAAMSLYDTGVTAEYGDHLITLSTCDYEEANGRFVVVAKKREN